MLVKLCYNHSENNCINKNIMVVDRVTATMKKDCSIENPIIELSYSGDITAINYIEIPALKRSYFINNIDLLIGGRYLISANIDVLQTYASDILNLPVIVNADESGDDYLQSDIWVKKCKDKTDIINFPNGLLDTGEYILITAGGIGAV